jgi:hypothetical protein
VYALEQLDAGHARHALIGDHHGDVGVAQELERLFGARGGQYVEDVRTGGFADDEVRLFIIDEQYLRHQRAHAPRSRPHTTCPNPPSPPLGEGIRPSPPQPPRGAHPLAPAFASSSANNKRSRLGGLSSTVLAPARLKADSMFTSRWHESPIT